ncbi:unnamed protein product [Heligmosomoides polygyrus]|uniref:Complement factor H-like n=1 Tax=Heligmosomoides polygyrus TaxID=6339 RepID=A0A3P8EAW3_HELPZ|nr:unnamed protein product [Heligmosomoides polygyrus]
MADETVTKEEATLHDGKYPDGTFAKLICYYTLSTSTVTPLSNGKYPEGTSAKMFCKKVDEKLDKEIAGTCSKGEWVKKNDATALQCPIRGCLPLQENDTVEYKYFKSENPSNEQENIAVLDWSGKFAMGTYAQRTCKKLKENTKVQDEFSRDISICRENGWEHRNKWSCPPPDSCDEADFPMSTHFNSVSISNDLSTEVYKREHPAATFYASGSMVQGYCNGIYLYLVCQNGEWFAENEKRVTCTANGITEIYGTCSRGKWVKENDSIVLQCPIRGCTPYKVNGTVRYEYLQYTVSPEKTLIKKEATLYDGEYPDGTFAKVVCKDNFCTMQQSPMDATEIPNHTGMPWAWEIYGTCSKGEWVKENDATVLQCPVRGCLPLLENDTVEYEYFKSEHRSKEFKNIAVLDWSGKFAVGSYARRICKELDENSMAQDKCAAIIGLHHEGHESKKIAHLPSVIGAKDD